MFSILGVISHFMNVCYTLLAIVFLSTSLSVLNHLLIAASQLYPMSWAFVKVYQNWCEYKGNKPTMIFFFHLFKVQSGSKYTNGFGLVSLK